MLGHAHDPDGSHRSPGDEGCCHTNNKGQGASPPAKADPPAAKGPEVPSRPERGGGVCGRCRPDRGRERTAGRRLRLGRHLSHHAVDKRRWRRSLGIRGHGAERLARLNVRARGHEAVSEVISTRSAAVAR
jgi:hypothetical protein